jgi:hypothetical protein
MKLDPDRYQCPEHNVDLTAQVTDALDDVSPPVAFRKVLLGSHYAEARPFQVIVTCPGTGGTGEHSLTCTGTWTR